METHGVYAVASSLGVDRVNPALTLAYQLHGRYLHLLDWRDGNIIAEVPEVARKAARALIDPLVSATAYHKIHILRSEVPVVLDLGDPEQLVTYRGSRLGKMWDSMFPHMLRQSIDGLIYLQRERQEGACHQGYLRFFADRTMRVNVDGKTHQDVAEEIIGRLPEFPNRTQ